MSNFDIDKILKPELPDYKGCIMSDEIEEKVDPYIESSFIINYDTKDKGGSHWVALKCDGIRNMYYFDSYGIPPLEPVSILAKKYHQKLIYNQKIIQPFDSIVCGELASAFLVLMRDYNNDFHHVINLLKQ